MKCMNTLTRWNRNLYGSVSVRHWGFPHCVRAHNHFDGHVKFKLKSLERWQTRTHLPKARKNTSEKQDETEWQTNKMLELPRKTWAGQHQLWPKSDVNRIYAQTLVNV